MTLQLVNEECYHIKKIKLTSPSVQSHSVQDSLHVLDQAWKKTWLISVN